ncbi:DUF2911 domain-containing protein [Hyunsoonleella sp. SJ7]|uniref:DUF2911 domain-containing protein n=1 Tax=Hyunsoonleella aquatilis TaxID=2762758 RepID=A0A923HDU3_9FLAO|nr:DUF2911 domain-containing protein [Hyunsoonleella aquatilis]MBC3759719.1 DUF2911 domain-containing protein [Hyunsoonleella aquatilis]
MKNYYSLQTFLLFLFVCLQTFAQLNAPRGSQAASVSQTVGITEITIKYSRPSVNDREIWGKLVPYGMNNLGFGTAEASPWRAGANENTTISFSDDVTIEGEPLAAGTYGFHIVVKEDDTATLIFSNNSTAWGSYFYEPSEDALRVDVVTNEIPHTELLTFSFNEVSANSTTASLNWEKKQIPFKIGVNVSEIVLDSFRQQLQGQVGFTRPSWEQAANYALNNDGDLNEALGWISDAIEGKFFSQKTFNNLQIKSKILDKMGKKEEAEKLAKESLEHATIFQIHQYGRTLIANGETDKALEIFKMNASKNKNMWPVNYGLARGYAAKGDYKKALGYLRSALKNAPNDASKGRVQANIEKLENGQDIN